MENSKKSLTPDTWLWNDNEQRFNSGLVYAPIVLPFFLFKDAAVFWAIAWIALLAAYLGRSIWAVLGEWWFLPTGMGERWVASQAFGGLMFPLVAAPAVATSDQRLAQVVLWLLVYGWWLACAIVGHHYPFERQSPARRRVLAIVASLASGLAGLLATGLLGLFAWRIFAEPSLWFIMLLLTLSALIITAGLLWSCWWFARVARHPQPPAAPTAPGWN